MILVFLIAFLIIIAIYVARYIKLRKISRILDSAQEDLNTMSNTLAKFKHGEVPLDRDIIMAHMKLKNHSKLK